MQNYIYETGVINHICKSRKASKITFFRLNCNKKANCLQPHAIIFLWKTAHSKNESNEKGALFIMDDSAKKNARSVKTAGDNQWTTTHQKDHPDKRPRRDGPGGEPARGKTGE